MTAETYRRISRHCWELTGDRQAMKKRGQFRIEEIAILCARRACGIPFPPLVAHWSVSLRNGSQRVIRGRSGCQATARLFRFLRRYPKDWTSYGTI